MIFSHKHHFDNNIRHEQGNFFNSYPSQKIISGNASRGHPPIWAKKMDVEYKKKRKFEVILASI